MKSKYNQVLALLLAVMMVISLLPAAALAADGEVAIAEPVEEPAETTEETTEITEEPAEDPAEETEEAVEETEEVTIANPADGTDEDTGYSDEGATAVEPLVSLTAGETYYIWSVSENDNAKISVALVPTGDTTEVKASTDSVSTAADGVVAVGTASSISENKTYALTIETAGWYSFTSGSADKLTEMTVKDSSGSIVLDYNVDTAGSRLTDQVQLAAGVYTIEVRACADNAKLTVAPFAANESLAFAAATNSALKVSATGATLSGAFTAPKIDTGAYLMGFEYRVKGTTATSVVWADTGVQQIEGEEHRKVLTDLTEGTTYEYRAFIDPSYGEQMETAGSYTLDAEARYGEWETFVMAADAEADFAAETGDAVVNGSNVTLYGSYTLPELSQNQYDNICCGVMWGVKAYEAIGGSGYFGNYEQAGESMAFEISDILVPGATYYYWAFIEDAMDSQNFTCGEAKSFIGPECEFETVSTGTAKTAAAYTLNHYCFTAGETGDYLLSLTCAVEGNLILTVYDSTGKEIARDYWLDYVMFQATAGETYYIDAYVDASEAGTLTIAKATTQTITLGQPVSGTGPFEISLTEGQYFIEADNDCFVEAYQGPDLWGTQSINSLFRVPVSAVYRFVPNKEVTNFRIVSLMDATLPAIEAGETETFTSEKYEVYFRFTAPQTGKYMIRIGSDRATYYRADGEYGFYCEDGSVVELSAEESIVIQVYDYGRAPDESWSGELSVVDLTSEEVKEIALDQTVTSSDSSILSFTPESAGFYVVETANGSARATSAEGYYMWNQEENGKTLFLVQSVSEYYLLIRQTAAGGTVKLRKAVDSDFRTMTAGESYNAVGFYCFTPQETSNYELTALNGMAVAYLSNGGFLASAYGTEEEETKGYLYLPSGQSAYVYVDSESTTIQKYTPAALELGTPVTLTDQSTRYCFTAETAGTYVIRALGLEGARATMKVSDSVGRSMAYGNLYLILNLEAGQTIYVDLSCVDGAGTAVIDKQENMIAGDLTSGETKTTSDAYQLWRFVPQQSGLYVASGPEWTTVYELDNAASSVISRNNSVAFLQLQEGVSYYFMTYDPNEMIQVESAEQFGITPIEQGQSVTPNGAAIYCFTAPEAGLYMMRSTRWGAGLYAKGMLDFGVGDVAMPLAKGEQVYLCAIPYATDGSLSIDRINVETAGTKLGVDTYTVEEAGNYVFQAPSDGTYVVCAEQGLYATVTWEDGARWNEWAGGSILALGTLKAGSCAFIQTYLERTGVSGTLKITKLADWPQKTATLGDNTKLDKTTLYRFTAEEAGEYTFSVTMPSEEYAYGCVYDQTMTRWDIYDDAYEQMTTTVSMLAGDSVYINVGNGTASKVLTIEKTGAGPENVADALNELVADSTKSEAEKREEIQNMDTKALMETLATSEDAVENLNALEKEVGSAGSVSIVVEETAQDVIEQSKVTIVGATLNELAADGANVTLTIRAASEDTVNELDIPDTVSEDESKVVHLELELEGVANAKELAVPVCITMEVPDNIQWELVRLVHYGEDGAETLTPVLYKEGDVTYARFVIGGFSPFTLTELAHTPGDVDGNGKKDIMDVLALLKSVAGIPTEIVYGDVNNSGAKDIMDVLALLKSVAGIPSEIF